MEPTEEDAMHVLRIRYGAPVGAARLVVQPVAPPLAVHAQGGMGSMARPSVIGIPFGSALAESNGCISFPRGVQPDREVYFEVETVGRAGAMSNFVAASAGERRPFIARVPIDETGCTGGPAGEGILFRTPQPVNQLRVRLVTHDRVVSDCSAWTLHLATIDASEAKK